MAHRPNRRSHPRWQVDRPKRRGFWRTYMDLWLRGAQRPLGRAFVAISVLMVLTGTVLGVLVLNGALR